MLDENRIRLMKLVCDSYCSMAQEEAKTGASDLTKAKFNITASTLSLSVAILRDFYGQLLDVCCFGKCF